MKALPILLIIFSAACVSGCNHKKASSMSTDNYPFKFKGLLQKTKMTSYMYGTHSVTGNGKTYALQSTAVNLDAYVNKIITIKGNKVEGYPVDDGPELIDVKAIAEN